MAFDRHQNHVDHSVVEYSGAFSAPRGIGRKLTEANRMLALAASAHDAANKWRAQAAALIADVETECRMQSVQAEIEQVEEASAAEAPQSAEAERGQLIGTAAMVALAKREGGASREALQIAGGMRTRPFPSYLKAIAERNGLSMRELPGPSGLTFYRFV